MVVHRDGRGRITQSKESDNTMSVTYNPAGQVEALTGSNGLIHSQLRYDARHRLIEIEPSSTPACRSAWTPRPRAISTAARRPGTVTTTTAATGGELAVSSLVE
jgi:YD repeat-containing protein